MSDVRREFLNRAEQVVEIVLDEELTEYLPQGKGYVAECIVHWLNSGGYLNTPEEEL